jgi:hypothetical protein
MGSVAICSEYENNAGQSVVMAVVVFKEIKPKRLKEKALIASLLKGIKETGEEIKLDYGKTTKTWRNKPVFEILSDLNPKGPEVLVGTDSLIYKFVDEGTSVRYALMTSDFQAKTTPGIIGSKGGRGGVVYVDKRRQRPGIKARKFSPIIQKKFQPRFKRRMEQAMKAGRKKSGHAI